MSKKVKVGRPVTVTLDVLKNVVNEAATRNTTISAICNMHKKSNVHLSIAAKRYNVSLKGMLKRALQLRKRNAAKQVVAVAA